VKGKPLFFYARNNEKVEIPSREIFIKRLELGKIRKIDNQKLLKNISKRVSRVKGPASTRVGLSTRGGDFRQKEILKIWRKNLKKNQFFYLVSFSIQCSSGTYVRSVANLLGQKTKIPALAFSISRRRIGKFML
jgi:tRNA U55 pseudouridine synthase TruB